MCNGSAKWIHRDCLNGWRLHGSNPRALTNCCECGFHYKLVLRATAGNDEQDRWRDMVRRVASQTLLGFVFVQAAILALGLACHTLDRREVFAKFAGVQDDPALGSTGPDLRQHKLVYYCAGAVVLVAVLGTIAAMRIACSACCGGDTTSAPTRRHAALDSGFCSCHACCDCCEVCSHECGGCCGHGCSCGDNCPASIGAGTQALHVFLFLLVVGVLAGVFGAAVALVTSAQKIVQAFAQLQEKRFLVEEYIVQDMANLEGVQSGLMPRFMPPSEVTATAELPAHEKFQVSVTLRGLPVSYGSTLSP